MVKYLNSRAHGGAPSDVAVFTWQGHPEFTSDIVLKVIDAREEAGIISADLARESRIYAAQQDQGVWLGARLLMIFMFPDGT